MESGSSPLSRSRKGMLDAVSRFVDWQELGLTAARGVLVYVVMLVVMRVLGKRTIGNFTAFDLLVALMLGEMVDEIIYGDVSIAQGLTAILVVAAAKYLTSWLTCWNHGLNNLLEGTPTEIVKNGELQRAGLRQELMNDLEVMAMLRQEGIGDAAEVKKAILEVDGKVSVLKEDWAEPVQRRDLERKKSKSHTTIPTDSPRALGEEE
jgi:uncharacterized membrane protein YcaP (DUF421 family)